MTRQRGEIGLAPSRSRGTPMVCCEVSLLLQPPDSGLTRKRHQGRVGTFWSYTASVGSRFGWVAASSPLQGVPSARRLPLHGGRGRFVASLQATRAPRSRSIAGNAVMAAGSSVGRACSLSASDTSNGSRRCTVAKLASEPEVAHEASVSATSIGRPPGSVRTSSRSIGPKRRATSAYGPSMLNCASENAAMRDCHEPVQSGPPA